MVFCVVLTLAPSLCACSGTFSSLKGSIFGAKESAQETGEQKAETAPLVYYVGSDDLALYREPGKTVVRRLPLHQKVHRYRLERGYAYVKVDGTDEEGWLENAKLIWRLPQERGAASEPPAAPPEGPDTAPPVADDTTAPPAATDSGSRDAAAPSQPSTEHPAESTPPVSPSVFEPF
jgi:hypothetical protein